MYEGNSAALSMKQAFLEGAKRDELSYPCTVIEYRKETEQVQMLLTGGKLEDISLDAMYECRIDTMTGTSACYGQIVERYINRAGKVLVMQVENGFYESNVKES